MPVMLTRGIFLVALVVVLVLSLIPVPQGMSLFSWQDKLEHAAAFMALALLAERTQWPRRWWIGGLLVYGIVIELVQGLTPHRMADPWDAAADALGVVAALALIRGVGARRA